MTVVALNGPGIFWFLYYAVVKAKQYRAIGRNCKMKERWQSYSFECFLKLLEKLEKGFSLKYMHLLSHSYLLEDCLF